MKIKIRKENKDGIVRLESSGKTKEFIFKEDFLNKDNSSLLICFRGKDSSGIIELESTDIDKIYKEIIYHKKLENETEVIEFSK